MQYTPTTKADLLAPLPLLPKVQALKLINKSIGEVIKLQSIVEGWIQTCRDCATPDNKEVPLRELNVDLHKKVDELHWQLISTVNMFKGFLTDIPHDVELPINRELDSCYLLTECYKDDVDTQLRRIKRRKIDQTTASTPDDTGGVLPTLTPATTLDTSSDNVFDPDFQFPVAAEFVDSPPPFSQLPY